MQPKLERLPTIFPIDAAQEPALRLVLDGQAKPPGSLGRLEDLAIRLALIRQTRHPRIERVALLLFAADHGLAQEGVSSEPKATTAAMVRIALAGRGAVNAVARAVDADITVIDAGVVADLAPHKNLVVEKIRHGTANAAREPAMTAGDAMDALTRGARIANQAIGAGADAIVPAEMGVGNGASAALLMHRLLPASLETCLGPAPDGDEAVTIRKRVALARAAARSAATEPFEVLCEFGGLEIAMMAGAIIGAASRRRPVILDGLVAGAAALVAMRLRPHARDYCIVAHRSAEDGHGIMLADAGFEAVPLLDLGLLLGQGTGALLAVPLLRAAALLLTDIASLKEALAGKA